MVRATIKATMQEIDNAVETLVRSFAMLDDAPTPDDIPPSMEDIVDESFGTFSRGYVGQGNHIQGDMAEIIGEKIEKCLKELCPDKTDEQCIEIRARFIKGLADYVAMTERHGQK